MSRLTKKLIILPLFGAAIFPKTTYAALQQVPTENGFATLSDLRIVFANVSAAVATLAGFGLLIMLIRAGFAYMTAQGDPKALQTARSSITWAIIGFVVILASYLIISLIVGFVGIPGQFCLPAPGQTPDICS